MSRFRRRRFGLPLVVMWLAFALRLYHLDAQSIWWDEGHSIFVATQPVFQIPTLPAMDVHPPAYFSLLHVWMDLAGRSEFALRYLSLIFSLLTVALLWRFGQLLARNIGSTSLTLPFLASLGGALSPMYVAYGQEVRSYAMITFLGLASTYLMWRLLFPGHARDTAGKRATLLISYIVLTTTCLYTHYFTIFLLLFQNLVWLLWTFGPVQRWSAGGEWAQPIKYSRSRTGLANRLGLWLASQAGIVLLFAPQLVLATRQVTTYTNPNLTPPTLAYFISRTWQAFTVGLTIDPGLARWGMWTMVGLITAISLVWLVARPRQPRSNQASQLWFFCLLIAWLLLPLVAYYLVLQRQPSFEPRYMILISPALFLLLAFSLSQALSSSSPSLALSTPGGKHLHKAWRALIFSLPLLVFLVGLHSYYTNEVFFKDDSAGVANWLATETTANDIAYVDVPHPFHYYAERGTIAAPMRYLFVDIHTAAETLNREAGGRDRLFWVTWWGSDTDPRDVVPFLAEKAGQSLGQRAFKGYRIEWFDLPDETGPAFSLPDLLQPVQATFGDVLGLDGVAYGGNRDSTTTLAGESAWVTLHFKLLRGTDIDYKVSVRLRSEDGQIASQIDRELLNDRHFRTSVWPLQDPALNQAINVYTLPLDPDTLPGTYQLEVVVYDSVPPYPSEGVTGQATADGTAAILGRITVVP